MKTEKEKMLTGENYTSHDPVLLAERRSVRKIIQKFNTLECPFDDDLKVEYLEVLQQMLPNSKPDTWIQPPFYCDYGYNIYCEENVFINYDCLLLDVAPIRIGRNALLAPNVRIYTAGHAVDPQERVNLVEFGKPVTIGRDCWIGGGAIICPGVTIGDRCVIGAGSVVTKDVPDDTVVAGNPARPLKKYDKVK